jgi:hypothetical protein
MTGAVQQKVRCPRDNDGMAREPISVEVLHTPTCSHWRAARDAVRRVADREGIDITLSEATVSSEEQAEALRFPGSPTVRVAGRDLQPEVEQLSDFGLG